MTEIRVTPATPQPGDVFLVPVVDDQVAVGRVVTHVEGYVLIAVYPDLVEPAGAVGSLAGKQHVFLLLTFDNVLAEGTWPTVGNWRPQHEIPVPTYKVRVSPGGHYEQSIDGVVGEPLTDEEAKGLDLHTSYTPNIVPLAMRALHGLAPWLPAFDRLRADR
ncbi:hypothetical protein JNUCC0626_39390 [Lentzea sp. JNUCC 0626]|uniref:hypothetical protein n=1 Tax=Lentzea sp. JNUCC 0626 TaxID=3367513 RepID=UPI003749DA98